MFEFLKFNRKIWYKQLSIGLLISFSMIMIVAVINIVYFQSFMLFQWLQLELKPALVFLFYQSIVAIVEEIVFRGFLLVKIEQWTKSSNAAIFLTAIIFGLLHFLTTESIAALVMSFVGGLLFAIAIKKIKYCSIYSLMLAHLIYNLAVINIA